MSAWPVVLVVDDESMVRRALQRELSAEFEVLEADGPAAALALLGSHGCKVVAIVSDLDMDGDRGAGLLLLARVAEELPTCIRILVSGSLAAQFGQMPHAEVTIAKPWTAGEIRAAIRQRLQDFAGR